MNQQAQELIEHFRALQRHAAAIADIAKSRGGPDWDMHVGDRDLILALADDPASKGLEVTVERVHGDVMARDEVELHAERLSFRLVGDWRAPTLGERAVLNGSGGACSVRVHGPVVL